MFETFAGKYARMTIAASLLLAAAANAPRTQAEPPQKAFNVPGVQMQGNTSPYAPGVPVFQQIGPTPVAKVEMRRESCGPNCLVWKLARSGGNLRMRAKVGMGCAKGAFLTQLAYQPIGGSPVVLFNSPNESNTGGHWGTYWTEPFTESELAGACNALLKTKFGSSPLTKVGIVGKTIKKLVSAQGRCSDYPGLYARSYPVTLRLECIPVGLR